MTDLTTRHRPRIRLFKRDHGLEGWAYGVGGVVVLSGLTFQEGLEIVRRKVNHQARLRRRDAFLYGFDPKPGPRGTAGPG